MQTRARSPSQIIIGGCAMLAAFGFFSNSEEFIVTILSGAVFVAGLILLLRGARRVQIEDAAYSWQEPRRRFSLRRFRWRP